MGFIDRYKIKRYIDSAPYEMRNILIDIFKLYKPDGIEDNTLRVGKGITLSTLETREGKIDLLGEKQLHSDLQYKSYYGAYSECNYTTYLYSIQDSVLIKIRRGIITEKFTIGQYTWLKEDFYRYVRDDCI